MPNMFCFNLIQNQISYILNWQNSNAKNIKCFISLQAKRGMYMSYNTTPRRMAGVKR